MSPVVPGVLQCWFLSQPLQEHYKRTFVALHDEVLAAFRTLAEDK